jgi:hypothetical protein
MPQTAAVSRGRWRADGGVKKTALATAASHHALAGERQHGRKWTRSGGVVTRLVTPRGSRSCRGSFANLRAVSAPSHEVTDTGGRVLRGQTAPRRRRTVERGRSSDMLPELNYLGISRGFEFSATYDRCCPAHVPAVEATAIGRSRHRLRGLGRAGTHAWDAKLDCVRNGVASNSSISLEPTPGGGTRGVVPPSIGARRRADRYATPRRPFGFRPGGVRKVAARALHRSRSGWLYEWSL